MTTIETVLKPVDSAESVERAKADLALEDPEDAEAALASLLEDSESDETAARPD